MRWFLIPASLLMASGCDPGTPTAPQKPDESQPVAIERPKDYWPKPFKRMVILGESTVEGGRFVAGIDERFADILVKLINSCQSEDMEYLNRGIPGNSLSPKSPAYPFSKGATGLQRYRRDVIEHKPDLFLLCYGLNDMCAGMSIADFESDMQTIITDVKSECEPLIVLTTVYHMTGFRSNPPRYDKGSVESTFQFNEAIRRLAKKNDCLLADVSKAEGLADWLVHPDGVHSNKVGHIVIANEIFNTIARSCSGIAVQVHERDRKTEYGKVQIKKREDDGDPFNPWWTRQ